MSIGMDGSVPDTLFLEERRRRLAAERTLDHTRRELARTHSALVANADRLSRQYLSERDQNLKMTERQQAVLQQRKEAAERADRARRRLWHALETMRDGFALFDMQGRLIAANHVYLDLFDAASELAPGCHVSEVFMLAADEGAFDIGDLRPAAWAQAQIARWDAEVIAPLTLQHYDGRILQFQDRRAPDGDVVSLVLDITEHRAREASLAAARDAAELTARAKADFLARMSHEIRTPMNGVIGLSQMLAEQADDPEMELFARTIHDSAEALLVIVNDTLDVSKLEAGKVELRHGPLDLESLLIDCLRLAAVAKHAGVRVDLTYPIGARTRFLGDEGRIRQIVMNLLGNALKFTQAGHVIVRVTPGDDLIRIAVEDTGPGIPEDKSAQVFEAFGQVDDPDGSSTEGTGLGLTISRGLAERMGGTLTLSSQPGTGSTFTLSLPLVGDGEADAMPPLPDKVAVHAGPSGDLIAARLGQAGCLVLRDSPEADTPILLPLALSHEDQRAALSQAADGTQVVLLGRREEADPAVADRADAVLPRLVTGAALAAAFAISPTTRPPRLLLADDNATNRLLLDRMLRDQPYKLDLVADGVQAVDAYARDRPDAVILDISMPGLDGFGAAAAIQTLEAERGGTPSPLLALTAHVGDDMAERLEAAGFMAYLTKPLKKNLLLEALTTALDRP